MKRTLPKLLTAPFVSSTPQLTKLSWFPGHMVKALRQIEEGLSSVIQAQLQETTSATAQLQVLQAQLQESHLQLLHAVKLNQYNEMVRSKQMLTLS